MVHAHMLPTATQLGCKADPSLAIRLTPVRPRRAAPVVSQGRLTFVASLLLAHCDSRSLCSSRSLSRIHAVSQILGGGKSCMRLFVPE